MNRLNDGSSLTGAPKANRLIHEQSPYLLQHAHNPVDWYPWGEEAFQKAREEDKPVLVSIGYAACHWCHVMERESFEDAEIAAYMNSHFVNIKVDREERPDVDNIYMDAVQAITGSGGWPLNVFLTPDRKPFYGGTYFPPVRAFNRASWREILEAIAQAYKEKRTEIEQQADGLTSHLATTGFAGSGAAPADQLFSTEKADQAFAEIMKTADKEWGGFGRAPKFPQTFTIGFLLQYAHLNNNGSARQQALASLDKMIHGGIYDQVGGGFARYATDREWLVPHFEKMLYDNALLIAVVADAFRLTKENKYREVIEETLQFVERELMHEQGGFYSSLDADSEGEEGKFYVWNYEEVTSALGADAAAFCTFYDITPGGNWEGKNILRVTKPVAEVAKAYQMQAEELRTLLNRGKEVLLQKRSGRVRPGLDDKVLLGWNALMNQAYSKAYAATGIEAYKETAVRNMHFLLTAFRHNGTFYHTWKNGQPKYPAFLDDYSFLIAALIDLALVTADYQWLDTAVELTQQVKAQFADTGSPLFFYTNKDQKDVIIRKKDTYDGATPSGNAVMAANLYHLSVLLDKPDWKNEAAQMLLSLNEIIIKYPTSFGGWLTLLYEMITGTNEVAITGRDWQKMLQEVLKLFLPFKVVMASERPLNNYPLLAGKEVTEENCIYLCKNYVCLRPVSSVEALMQLVKAK